MWSCMNPAITSRQNALEAQTASFGESLRSLSSSLQTSCASLETSYTSLRESNAKLEASNTTLQIEVEGLRQDNTNLHVSYNESYAKLRGSYAELHESYATLNGSYATLRASHDTLRALCETCITSCAEARKLVESVQFDAIHNGGLDSELSATTKPLILLPDRDCTIDVGNRDTLHVLNPWSSPRTVRVTKNSVCCVDIDVKPLEGLTFHVNALEGDDAVTSWGMY